jgi:hypothetical protein
MSDMAVKEEEARKRQERRQTMENTIEEAKWNMYAENWQQAVSQLNNAKNTAVSLHDKAKIDEILRLLNDCESQKKPEL